MKLSTRRLKNARTVMRNSLLGLSLYTMQGMHSTITICTHSISS